jgi:hypothetical protein
MAYGFAVAAIERDGCPDLFAIAAADFEAVGAPAQVGAFDSDAAIVAALAPQPDVQAEGRRPSSTASTAGVGKGCD